MATNFTFLTDEPEEILDEIRTASKYGYAEKNSIVDNLLKRGWCRENDLLFAYDDFSKSEGERVTVFFQLPFQIKFPEYSWVKVRSEYGNPYFACSPINNETDVSQTSNCTQIFISFQLWDNRRQFYPLYLKGLETKQEKIKVDYKSKGYWRLQDYERDVAKRLWLQSREILKEFIPIYKIVCKDTTAFIVEDLQHYFIMFKNGRVFGDLLKENDQFKKNSLPISNENLKGNLKAFEKRLKPYFPPSLYETNLLEVRRLIENGNYDLALVQAIVILDWFANEIIESHLISDFKKCLSENTLMFDLAYERIWEKKTGSNIRVNTITKFITYFPAIGIELPSKLLTSLKKIYSLRNEIVHRYKTNLINREVAEEALETGMEIVHFSMKCLVSKYSNKEND